jgi:uncharacterized cupredoxin-like copper-binding protein
MSPAGRITGALFGALLLPSACSTGPRTVSITIKDSHYSPVTVHAHPGETIRFVVDNTDPIEHEFIIGTHAEQLVHERGTQASHDGLPGQATLDIGETQAVTYTFATAGVLEFACHRPGHYAYGMRGRIVVR